SIAGAYATLGDEEKASELLAEAVKTAGLISDVSFKAEALLSIADSYAELGDKEKASELLAEAVKTAGLISYGFSKTKSLCSIAVSYAKLGDKKKASEQLVEAVKTAGLITDVEMRVAIVESYAKVAKISDDRILYAQTFRCIEGL